MNILAGSDPSIQSLKVFHSMFLFFIHCLKGKLCLALESLERSMGVPLLTPMLADTTVRTTFFLVSLKPALIWVECHKQGISILVTGSAIWPLKVSQ